MCELTAACRSAADAQITPLFRDRGRKAELDERTVVGLGRLNDRNIALVQGPLLGGKGALELRGDGDAGGAASDDDNLVRGRRGVAGVRTRKGGAGRAGERAGRQGQHRFSLEWKDSSWTAGQSWTKDIAQGQPEAGRHRSAQDRR